MEQELTKYTRENFQKQKTINRPYELRKQIANLVDRPIEQIMGLTRGFSEYDLNGLLTDALAFKENSPAYAWKIIKQLKEKYAKNI